MSSGPAATLGRTDVGDVVPDDGGDDVVVVPSFTEFFVPLPAHAANASAAAHNAPATTRGGRRVMRADGRACKVNAR